MIKNLEAKTVAQYQILLEFSDDTKGIWNAETLLATRKETLLEPLRNVDYFEHFFLDAGALC